MSLREIENFMNGALVQWVESCLPKGTVIADYSALLDGTALHSVYLQIDPTPRYHLDEVVGSSRQHRALHNFTAVVNNLISLYVDNFNQTVLYLPDCAILSEQPASHKGIEQMKLLITLLLGAAVQCSNQEKLIKRIQSLNEAAQTSIMTVIREVIEGQSLVLNQPAMENLSLDANGKHVVRLVEERDHYWALWTRSEKSAVEAAIDTAEIGRLTASLAASKDQINKLRQEGDEAAELLRKLKTEFECKNKQYQELSVKSQDWYSKAQRVSAYRDEADALRERAERAEYAEKELRSLRPKLDKLDFYCNRVNQLEEDKSALEETKKLVEGQLDRLQQRHVQLSEMEAETERYRHEITNMSQMLATANNQIEELIEENAALQLSVPSSTVEKVDFNEHQPSARYSLSDQLTSHVKSKNIKLELENRRLQADLECLKQSPSKSSAKDLQFEERLKTLKMDNSQLASSRNSLQRQLELIKQDHETLQRLHAQLNDDKAMLGSSVEELKVYNRSLKDHVQKQSNEMNLMEQKMATLAVEHSELQDDFQQIFQENDQLKSTNNSLVRQMVDLEVELKHKLERIAVLETEYASVNQRCEMLYSMNTRLDNEKRAEREQYSNLLNQYNQLMADSLDDTKHFHENEKMYMEKINELQRLKEKLEEKILAFYGKGNNSTPSKKNKKNPLSAFTFSNLRKNLMKSTPEKEKPKATGQSDKETATPDAGSIESDASSEEVFLNQLPSEREDSDFEGDYVNLRNYGARRSLMPELKFRPTKPARSSLPG